MARYGNRNGFATLARDVALLKTMVNVEKKRCEATVLTSQALGQCYGNSDTGWQCVELFNTTHINITQGVTAETRNGASVKLTGMNIRLQFYHQSATTSPTVVKMYVVREIGQPLSSLSGDVVAGSTGFEQFLIADQLTGYTDFNSLRNPDYMRQFKIVCTRNIKVQCDQLTGQQIVKNLQLNLKLNSHLRYAGDTTLVVEGQYFIALLPDNGNCSTTQAQTTSSNISNSAVSTGLICNLDVKAWYVDN